jgi:hypothetical protein
MPRLRTYHVFISHAWDYDDDYDRLVGLLEQAPSFSWLKVSVPRHDCFHEALSGAALARALEAEIREADCVLIIGGMYCTYREWIQEEIEIAQAHRIPIIGIYLWGAERTPTEVTTATWEMVGWNSGSIVAAIRRLCR